MRGLAPPRCYFTLERNLLPSQVFRVVGFLEAGEIQLVQIANAVVLSLASSEHIKGIVIDARRMEPSGLGPHVSLHLDLPPGQALEAVQPQISQIVHPFSPEHHQIGEAELRSVIRPFPRGRLILKGQQLDPLQCIEIHHEDRIEALFIESSASEQHQLVVVRVVVQRCVGARRGTVAKDGHLCPAGFLERITPQIIQVI